MGLGPFTPSKAPEPYYTSELYLPDPPDGGEPPMSKAQEKYLHRDKSGNEDHEAAETRPETTSTENTDDKAHAPLGTVGEYAPHSTLAGPLMAQHKAIEAIEVEASRLQQVVLRLKGGTVAPANVAQVRKFDDSATVEAHSEWLVHRLNTAKDAIAQSVAQLQTYQP